MTDRPEHHDHRLARLIAALVPAPEAWVRRAEAIALARGERAPDDGPEDREPHEPDA